MTPEEFVAAVEHVTRVTLLNVEPGATVLLEVDRSMTHEELHRLSEHARRLFDPHKVAVLGEGVRVSGLRIGDAGAHDASGEQVGQDFSGSRGVAET